MAPARSVNLLTVKAGSSSLRLSAYAASSEGVKPLGRRRYAGGRHDVDAAFAAGSRMS